MTKDLDNVQAPINDAPSEVRRIIEQVVKVERDRLHMKNPRGINEDILDIVKREVQ
jgi:hypothetical protein